MAKVTDAWSFGELNTGHTEDSRMVVPCPWSWGSVCHIANKKK
jgi:hypothetical protein